MKKYLWKSPLRQAREVNGVDDDQVDLDLLLAKAVDALATLGVERAATPRKRERGVAIMIKTARAQSRYSAKMLKMQTTTNYVPIFNKDSNRSC